MENKNQHFNIERQVKRLCSEQINCFCYAAYCVKQYSIIMLKLWWVIKNWFENFMKFATAHKILESSMIAPKQTSLNSSILINLFYLQMV